MALSDLVVFQEWAYKARTETLNRNLELFNSFTNGGIQLRQANHTGDFSEAAFWKSVNLVRRRNAYSTSAISDAVLSMGKKVDVKIDAGTPRIVFYEADLKRIQRNPAEHGTMMGIQLAKQMFDDMLRCGIGGYIAATANEADVYQDISGTSSPGISMTALVNNNALFGDASGRIVARVMHSKTRYDLLRQGLENDASLFVWENVNVFRDPEGKPLVVTDMPPLVVAGSPTDYYTLGLTAGAIDVQDNGVFDDNPERNNGYQQIQSTYQAEWSYTLGLKGYSWDETTGGPSPNDAAINSSANWDRISTDHKDLGGVLLRTI